MSLFKKKLLLTIFGSILVLMIIGLSVGIVLVANRATLGASMSVSYKATNVACTIISTAQVFDVNDEAVGEEMKPMPDHITIEAGDSELVTTSGLMEYQDEVMLVGGADYAVFTLTVRNDATDAPGASAITAVAEMTKQSTNMLILVDDKDAEVIDPQDTGIITVKVSIIDPNMQAHFEGSVKLTITQVQTVNN